MSDVEDSHVNDSGGGDDPTVTVVDLSVCPDEAKRPHVNFLCSYIRQLVMYNCRAP